MLEISLLPALSDNYIYLLHDTVSQHTAAVDPAEAAPVMRAIEQRGWRLDYILNTHHHADHVGANRQLKAQTACQIVGAAEDCQRIPGIDLALNDGEKFFFGQHTISAISTPGHTLGHIVYYCEDSSALFCGDTLFSLGCGRLFEGSAEQMWQSLQRLTALPPQTRVYCAHEYTAANGRFALSVESGNPDLINRLRQVAELRAANQPTLPSTIAQELATNPFLRAHSPSLRKSLGLDADASALEVFSRLRKLKDQFS